MNIEAWLIPRLPGLDRPGITFLSNIPNFSIDLKIWPPGAAHRLIG
jgi:hypothetical protein